MSKNKAPSSVVEYLRKIASKGGLRRAASLTPARRLEISKKAALASARARKSK